MKFVIFLLGSFSLFCFASSQMVGRAGHRKIGYYFRRRIFHFIQKGPYAIATTWLAIKIDEYFHFGIFDDRNAAKTVVDFLDILVVMSLAALIVFPLMMAVMYIQKHVIKQKGPTEKYRRLVPLERIYSWIGFFSGCLCLGLSLWGLEPSAPSAPIPPTEIVQPEAN